MTCDPLVCELCAWLTAPLVRRSRESLWYDIVYRGALLDLVVSVLMDRQKSQMFADDIVIYRESREQMEGHLERWRFKWIESVFSLWEKLVVNYLEFVKFCLVSVTYCFKYFLTAKIKSFPVGMGFVPKKRLDFTVASLCLRRIMFFDIKWMGF